MKKKSLLVAVLSITSVFSFAQGQEKTSDSDVLKTKRGRIILPQEGDIALGFNAVPLLNFALNATKIQSNPNNGTQADDGIITFAESANHQLVGKYFLTDKSAVRVRLGINTLNGSRTTRVQDALAMAAAVNGTQDDIDAASLIRVKDQLDYQKRNVNVVVGYEKRRGYGRLQGFYGAEGGINWTKSDAQVEYGNEFSDQHQVEYTTFTSNTGSFTSQLDPTSNNDASRFLSQEFRGGIGFGLRAFIGVEYFFAPKMSVGVEYGWGYTYTNVSASKTTNETYHNGQNGPEVLIEEIDNDQSSSSHSFGIDNNNNGSTGFSNTFNNTSLSGSSGSITLLLHF